MEFLEKFEQVLDRQPWLDNAGQSVQRAIQGIYTGAGSTGIKVRDALHGVWLGHPLHAVITDVTVGAILAALFLDGLDVVAERRRPQGRLRRLRQAVSGEPVSGLGEAAAAALGLGVASGLASGLTGATDWQHTMDRPRRVGFIHALLNLTSLVFYGLSLLQRRRGSRPVGRVLSLGGSLFTLAAGYLGGHMAYGFKVGMNRAPVEGLPEKFSPVMDEADLAENTPTRAYYKDIPLVLVRRGKQIYALAETCAHMGGPLAEGTVEIDETTDGPRPVIVCPWHASRFALENGRVCQGPSVYSQPSFETRLRQAKIEVRARPNPELYESKP